MDDLDDLPADLRPADRLEPDRDQLEVFVNAIFRHAGDRGYVAARSFYENGDKVFRKTVAGLSGGLTHVVDVAEDEARRAAQNPKPVVFCPPLAVFNNPDHASENDLDLGLVLTAECDQRPQQAKTKLEDLLGPATVVVASGGQWTNPQTTELEPKIHLHWRLQQPTATKAEHARLKEARVLAARLVGSDRSSGPIVHPLRWPGSWHRKHTPRLTRIVAASENEIDLTEALERLRDTVGAIESGDDNVKQTGRLAVEDHGAVALALAVIPNDSNRPEHDYWWWNRIGMATWAATGGSEIGRVAFHEWSAKADKYDRVATESRWQHYRTSPPNRLGFGSLVYLARQHQPEWTHRRDSKIVKATPYVCVDPSTIPRRRWLYRPHYIRQFLSATFATGGTGKSSLVVVEALAMTSGKNLLGILPEDQLRVWYWNGEDPSDELQRSIGAAMKHYGLTGEHIEDRLFVDSGRTMPIVIAEDTRVGTRIAEPVIRQVIATLLENRIDVLIVDPFVSCHRVFENDNSAIDRVAKSWSHIAEVTNCAVMLVHHSRKTNGESVDVADGRGASALQDAVRMIRTLNVMTAKEAEGAEIEERHRRRFLRADLGKAKLTRPAEKADWFHLESVDLGNGPVITDPIAAQFSRGDDVGVVVSWSYPAVDRREPTTTDVTRVLEIIESNGPWRFDIRARNEKWVGIAVAEVLDLDVTRKPQRDRVAKLVDDWLQRGWLEKQVRQHPGTRKVHHYVVAGPVRPG